MGVWGSRGDSTFRTSDCDSVTDMGFSVGLYPAPPPSLGALIENNTGVTKSNVMVENRCRGSR